MRPDLIVARMQKAAAVMQFKLEGQVIDRNPQWDMEHRRLLHRIDPAGKTIEVDGVRYPLCDTHLPTRGPGQPLRALGRGAGVHRPPAPVVPGQPEARRAHAATS